MTIAASITVDGTPLQLTLVRKRVQNINARLIGPCLQVSAPPHLADDHLRPLIEALARRLLRRRRAREVNGAGAAQEVVRRVAARFPSPLRVARVEFVSSQTRRWGSYSARTGVSWLAQRWPSLPPVEKALLAGIQPDQHSGESWRHDREGGAGEGGEE